MDLESGPAAIISAPPSGVDVAERRALWTARGGPTFTGRLEANTFAPMDMIPIEDAERRMTELASRVEAGETVTLTREGKPVLDLVPHVSTDQPKRGGFDYEAARRWMDERGIKDPFPYIADDFDDPLPEDFLLRPLP